jgi:hypothetical protein
VSTQVDVCRGLVWFGKACEGWLKSALHLFSNLLKKKQGGGTITIQIVRCQREGCNGIVTSNNEYNAFVCEQCGALYE